MKPLEFLTDVGQHNERHGDMMEAITNKDLIITDGEHSYRVLSYYLTKKGMCLDIERKDK